MAKNLDRQDPAFLSGYTGHGTCCMLSGSEMGKIVSLACTESLKSPSKAKISEYIPSLLVK